MTIYCALCIALDVSDVQLAYAVIDGNSACTEHWESLIGVADLAQAVARWEAEG